jgi:hypothetical protein
MVLRNRPRTGALTVRSTLSGSTNWRFNDLPASNRHGKSRRSLQMQAGVDSDLKALLLVRVRNGSRETARC